MTKPSAGESLRAALLAELPPGMEFDSRELALLDRACSCADMIEALDRVVAEEGPTTTGSRGQTVVHPALMEARQQKLVMLRLLRAIELPVEADESPSARRARRAATARWERRERGVRVRDAS